MTRFLDSHDLIFGVVLDSYILYTNHNHSIIYYTIVEVSIIYLSMSL